MSSHILFDAHNLCMVTISCENVAIIRVYNRMHQIDTEHIIKVTTMELSISTPSKKEAKPSKITQKLPKNDALLKLLINVFIYINV